MGALGLCTLPKATLAGSSGESNSQPLGSPARYLNYWASKSATDSYNSSEYSFQNHTHPHGHWEPPPKPPNISKPSILMTVAVSVTRNVRKKCVTGHLEMVKALNSDGSRMAKHSTNENIGFEVVVLPCATLNLNLLFLLVLSVCLLLLLYFCHKYLVPALSTPACILT